MLRVVLDKVIVYLFLTRWRECLEWEKDRNYFEKSRHVKDISRKNQSQRIRIALKMINHKKNGSFNKLI